MEGERLSVDPIVLSEGVREPVPRSACLPPITYKAGSAGRVRRLRHRLGTFGPIIPSAEPPQPTMHTGMPSVTCRGAGACARAVADQASGTTLPNFVTVTGPFGCIAVFAIR